MGEGVNQKPNSICIRDQISSIWHELIFLHWLKNIAFMITVVVLFKREGKFGNTSNAKFIIIEISQYGLYRTDDGRL